ncbi:MAG: ABC transporter ATP-binding protein [Deltaproteobacteria bacterium]|nr:ABC transporter ATP-binding protein [Deltaproteobacteria bacterium]
MILNVRDVVKIYELGSIKVLALRGVSLEVEKGSFVAIMGPSGSGKSTLMNIIGCLDHPTKGSVEIEGIETSEMDRSQLAYVRNKKIGFIFQSFNLLPRVSALENVMLPFLYSNQPKNHSRERALEILKSVGLEDRIMHKPNELSGGQKQRVAIARALVNDPAIILADEPTGNVDSRSGVEIMALLQQLNNNAMTILMVTHDSFIAQHANRIIHFSDGKIVQEEMVRERKCAIRELEERSALEREDLL